MQAIILAGGMGTRLRPLTYTMPKPMLPVAGKPALAHIVEALAKAGCREVIVTTNYLAPCVRERLDSTDFALPVRCVEEEKPLGTAGCIVNLIDELEEEFIVVQGDSVSEVDYTEFLKFHREKNADVTIATLRVEDTREFGICEIDEDGRILRFQEKPRPEEAFSNLANAGFYILKRELFDDVPRDEPYDFGRQLFPRLMEAGRAFYAWEMQGFWIDIGRINNYITGNLHLIEGRAEVAPDVIVSPSAVLTAPYFIGSGTKIGAGARIGPGAVIGANCAVGENAHVVGSVVHDDVVLGPNVRLTDCVVAARAQLGRDVRVEAMSVIGEECELGAGVQVESHSRVGPVTPVAPGTLVEGVLEPRSQKLRGLQRIVVSSSLMEQLTPDEREVYAILAEYGELNAREIAEIGTIPLLRVMGVLHALEKSGQLLSTLDQPRRYALTSEEQLMPGRILVAGDSDDVSEKIRSLFASRGHSIRTVRDGLEVVEAVREERFDAVIMETEMPTLNGWDATRLIRGMPNGRRVPVVLRAEGTLVNGEFARTQERAREVGANHLISAHAPASELTSVLQNLGRELT